MTQRTHDALIADRLELVAQLLEATNGLLAELAERMRQPAEPAEASARRPSSTRQNSQRRLTGASRSGRARETRAPGRSRAGSPRLHEEIIDVLRDAGEPLRAGEIAERVQRRGRYVPPRRTTPVDGSQISARVGHPQYRALFTRTNGRIALP